MHCVTQQLDGTDDKIKVAGLKAIANIAQHSQALAEAVAEKDILEKAVALLQEPTTVPDLQGTVCAMLTACAIHSAQLCRRILNAGCVLPMVKLLQPRSRSDVRVQAAALQCLAHLSSYESASAQLVAKAVAAPPAIRLAMSSNSTLRRPATSLLQQLASRTSHLCATVASDGCVTALISALRSEQGTPYALAPLMALGHIGSSAATFARAVRIKNAQSFHMFAHKAGSSQFSSVRINIHIEQEKISNRHGHAFWRL